MTWYGQQTAEEAVREAAAARARRTESVALIQQAYDAVFDLACACGDRRVDAHNAADAAITALAQRLHELDGGA